MDKPLVQFALGVVMTPNGPDEAVPLRERDELPLLLAMVFRAMTDRVHQRLAAEGQPEVRPAHGFAISHLLHTGGVTAVELGAYLGITKQGAAHMVGELTAWGHVRRVPHPTDGRSRLIVATEKGAALVERVAELWRADEARWAGLVGGERLDTTREALRAYLEDSGGERQPMRPVW
jgi:DNA-binding MarR family transcriptional regulator